MTQEVKHTKLCDAKAPSGQGSTRSDNRQRGALKKSKPRDDYHIHAGKACEVRFRQSMWFTIFAGKMTHTHTYIHAQLANLFLNGAFWDRRVVKKSMYEHIWCSRVMLFLGSVNLQQCLRGEKHLTDFLGILCMYTHTGMYHFFQDLFFSKPR